MNECFGKIDVSPAYKVVCDAIERQILSGRLEEGDQLPTETDLASQLGVNRSTVREGLRLLEQRGLLRRGGGRRLHVAVPRHIDMAPGLTKNLLLQKVTLRELWEVLMMLEPPTAAQATRTRSSADLRALEVNLDKTGRAVADGESVVGLDVEFHRLIAEAVDNRVLLLCREPISALIYPSVGPIMKVNPDAAQRLLDAHTWIYEGIRDGEPARAETWMRKHIEDFRRAFDRNQIDMDCPVGQILPEGGAGVSGA
ncbi:FadR family transcriptional regulator [Ectothiorhodospiraceae bacterium WFHF3C12]|nr:FadR family transcriptional regulator [Ectothiorhodospiraceae bacterium WFHF3C12]